MQFRSDDANRLHRRVHIVISSVAVRDVHPVSVSVHSSQKVVIGVNYAARGANVSVKTD